MAWTPLHQAKSGERIRELIAEGLDVNETDGEGRTPLHVACVNKDYDKAEALLGAGAQVDPLDKWGNTPLNSAVFEKDALDLVKLLIEHGADPTIGNINGHSPLSEAKRYQENDYVAVFTAAGYS